MSNERTASLDRPAVDVSLLLVRVSVGLIFAAHGSQKLLGYPPGQPYTGFPVFTMLGIAGMLEFAGGLLILVGLFTRPTAFILSGEMAVAYFMGPHWSRSFFPISNFGEITVILCFYFLYLSAAGAGVWSLDRLLSKSRPRSA